MVLPYHIDMISQAEFGNTSDNPLTLNKSALKENPKYDGPGELKISNEQDRFSPNHNIRLAKPGFSD